MKMTYRIPALLLALLAAGCGGSGVDSPPAPPGEYTAFINPEPVPILGYAGHIMEPFVSRDGRYLFFNNMGTNKDIFYATWDASGDNFVYTDVITAINTPAVEGVPTLDDDNRFYYISTFNYPPSGVQILDTIYVGDFDPATPAVVVNLAVVPNLHEGILGHLNFDVEISPDGTTLYFVDGIFSGNSFPDVSNFVYAVDGGGGFVRQTDSAAVFANINTENLEYAACISRDGREFFFTRLDLETVEFGLYRATRPNLSAAFGVPQRLGGISGFVEAPALSADEKVLYYHRLNPVTDKFELYRVTRP